jgi:hypothetical protein
MELSPIPVGNRVFESGNTGKSARRATVCDHELEGVVAKRRSGRYLPGERGWIKTKNRGYWRYEMEREGRNGDVGGSGGSSRARLALSWARVYAQTAVRSQERRDWMTFTFKLQQADGTPAEPSSFQSVVLNWRPGDTIPIGRDRTLRVVGVVAGAAADDDPVLIVESAGSKGDAA